MPVPQRTPRRARTGSARRAPPSSCLSKAARRRVGRDQGWLSDGQNQFHRALDGDLEPVRREPRANGNARLGGRACLRDRTPLGRRRSQEVAINVFAAAKSIGKKRLIATSPTLDGCTLTLACKRASDRATGTQQADPAVVRMLASGAQIFWHCGQYTGNRQKKVQQILKAPQNVCPSVGRPVGSADST